MGAPTPGPWGITQVQYADHLAWAVIELNGYEYICRPVLREGHADLEFANFKADARLIAAAPKLLAALVGLRKHIIYMLPDPSRAEVVCEAIKTADAAIAAATETGETK